MRTGRRGPTNVDEYIAGYPPEVQVILRKIRKTVREVAPGAQEAINYKMPAYWLKGNLIHFAAYKKHIGMYPAPTAVAEFKKELSIYKGAKSTMRFPLDEPIPFDLIRRIVKFRVKENLKKAAAKRE